MDGTLGRRVDASQQFKQCAFAAAVSSDYAKEFTLFYLERYIVQRFLNLIAAVSAPEVYHCRLYGQIFFVRQLENFAKSINFYGRISH